MDCCKTEKLAAACRMIVLSAIGNNPAPKLGRPGLDK